MDLIERGGLYWLKFRRAIVPAAHHAAPDAKFVMSDAASFAAQSKFRPATVVDDDDPCICTLLEEPSRQQSDSEQRAVNQTGEQSRSLNQIGTTLSYL